MWEQGRHSSDNRSRLTERSCVVRTAFFTVGTAHFAFITKSVNIFITVQEWVNMNCSWWVTIWILWAKKKKCFSCWLIFQEARNKALSHWMGPKNQEGYHFLHVTWFSYCFLPYSAIAFPPSLPLLVWQQCSRFREGLFPVSFAHNVNCGDGWQFLWINCCCTVSVWEEFSLLTSKEYLQF